MKTVRAIDVGHGSCKFTTDVTNQVKEIKCSQFPSMAVVEESSRLGRSYDSYKEVVSVEVAKARFLVGKDIGAHTRPGYSPVLDPEFVSSNPYKALFLGALHHMDVPHIDLLVVGLPVSTFEAKRLQVAAMFKGEHVSGNRKTIVKDVLVVPQPLGGLYSALESQRLLGRGLSEMNVIIDPGYFTTDWVTARGTKLLGNRSGVHRGGMSSVFGHIAARLDYECKTHTTDFSRIESAIRRKAPLTVRGTPVDLKRYTPGAFAIIDEAVSFIASKLGACDDVDRFILVGGGSGFFEKALRVRYPLHQFITEKEPAFANVRGFALIGLGKVAAKAAEATRDA